MVRIAAVQLAPVVGELHANLASATDAIEGALRNGAELVVLPELAISGYVFDTVDEARSQAVPASAPVFEEWAALAASHGGAIIVAGFAEAGEDGRLYNSAAVIGGDGVIGLYRKVHLWDSEKKFFTPGGDAPLVVDTPHGRLGVMICFDLEFPEWTRLAALADAEILVVPTNWPYVQRPPGERAPEVTIGMAAARVNRMAIVCSDRAGVERGVAWNEGTAIISADGWVLDSVGPGIGVAWADVDPALSRDKQLSEFSHALADRRPDLYSAIILQP